MMMLRCVTSMLAGLSLTACLAAADNQAIYSEKLEPIISKHCQSCHGDKAPPGGLSVTSLEALLKGGKRGPAINPGQSSASLVVQFARGDKNPRMPVGGDPLPDSVIAQMAAAIDAMQAAAKVVSSADSHAKWAFSTPAAPKIPEIKNAKWVKNPIDAFILAKLDAKNLAPAPPAGKRALMRRLYFDVIGLPPTLEEAEAFLKDDSPDAYERLVDKLLADKRYGERWARHWLDLVRFAESDGFAIDGERPTAWRYRDYVIRAFNNDKPYDLFVQEQLAGDEIDRARREGASEAPVALGYLRMGPWEADANFDNQLRLDWLNELTGTTAQVFMGMTVGCARCHDHKYDPIPQRDFYRMQAFFASTRVDERPAPFLDEENRVEMRKRLRQYEDEIDVANGNLQTSERALRAKYEAAKPDAKKQKGETDAKAPPGDGFQKALADKKNKIFTEDERAAHNDLKEAVRRLQSEMMRYRPVAYSVNEVAPPAVLEIAPTYVLSGGELAAKGDKVEPGFLQSIAGKQEDAVIPFSGRYRSGRRRALAEWIASPTNPLTARVMMNRMWQHHFGEGIVRTPSDFGMNGDRPSHPELLDWLATEFVEKKWSMKAMHRLMLTSSAYQQSTGHPDWKSYAEADPENRLLWRANWIRLESEVLRDSILSVSGRLNMESGGPGMFFSVSDDVAKGFQMFKWYPSDEAEQRRRSIYAFQRRSLMMPMMEVFDGANMSESCSRRSVTTVAPQALTLLNGSITAEGAKYFADRIIELAGPDVDHQIDKAFSLALAREATDSEKEKVRELYSDRKPKEALTRLATVLFNMNEFLYLE